ncbi:hypothetical protein [Profundibacter sp.]
MNNMEKSELVVTKILSRLMDNGFTRTVLSFQDLDLTDDYKEFFDLSVEWLLDEMIIRAANFEKVNNGSGSLVNPVLTAYGLSLLRQPSPVSGDEGETMGTAIKNASEKGTSYAGIGDFFGGLLGGFTKSIGSG